MKFKTRVCLFAAALTAITCFGTAGNAEAGRNGWRWAKPLNQKAGSAFYTSNRRAHRQTKSRHQNSYRSYRSSVHTRSRFPASSRHPRVPVHPPARVIDSTPRPQVPSQSIPAGRVIRAKTPVVQPSTKAPSVLDRWLAH